MSSIMQTSKLIDYIDNAMEEIIWMRKYILDYSLQKEKEKTDKKEKEKTITCTCSLSNLQD